MSEILVVPLRYDGLDAEQHELRLDALGDSIKGAARILSVVGNFAVTSRHVHQSQMMDVRVVAREPRANCFTIEAVLQFAQQHQLLQGFATITVTSLFAWIIAKSSNNKVEMKLLSENLSRAIDGLAQGNVDQKAQLLAVVDKMADALKPATRQLVAPIGRSCRQLSVGGVAVIDEATAEAIRGDANVEVDEERDYTVLITELDLEKMTAKVRLSQDSEHRIRAVITDPDIGPYALAFAEQRSLDVRAKAILREGHVRALYVSNAR